MKNKLRFGFIGFCAGILNGFFGAGGGLAVVPMLKSRVFAEDGALTPQRAHATSIAVIFPLCIISAALYLKSGITADWRVLLYTLPLGAGGAAVGAALLKKINPKYLKRIFGAVMIISAVRIFLK